MIWEKNCDCLKYGQCLSKIWSVMRWRYGEEREVEIRDEEIIKQVFEMDDGE